MPGPTPGWVLTASFISTSRRWEKLPWRGLGRVHGGPGPGVSTSQDKGQTTSQKPEGWTQPPETRDDDTVRIFQLLFFPTEPLQAEAPADNSDNLILNQAFLAGN